MMSGLERIKDLFSDDDKTKDVMKKSVVPMGLMALIGGALLTKKLRKPPKVKPGWKPGQRENFIKKITDKIKANLRPAG